MVSDNYAEYLFYIQWYWLLVFAFWLGVVGVGRLACLGLAEKR